MQNHGYPAGPARCHFTGSKPVTIYWLLDSTSSGTATGPIQRVSWFPPVGLGWSLTRGQSHHQGGADGSVDDVEQRGVRAHPASVNTPAQLVTCQTNNQWKQPSQSTIRKCSVKDGKMRRALTCRCSNRGELLNEEQQERVEILQSPIRRVTPLLQQLGLSSCWEKAHSPQPSR